MYLYYGEWISVFDAHVVVGTPFSLEEVMSRYENPYSKIKMVICDEWDWLVHHKADQHMALPKLFQLLPKNIQMVFFSTTLDDQSKAEAVELLKSTPDPTSFPNPMVLPYHVPSTWISIYQPPSLLLHSQLSHDVTFIPQLSTNEQFQFKIALLKEIIENCICAVIIFNEIEVAQCVYEKLYQSDYSCAIYDESNFGTIQGFRSGQYYFLLITDTYMRGLDIHHVALVVNFECPQSGSEYIRRCGACGRFGRKGQVKSFVCEEEKGVYEKIMKYMTEKSF